MSNPLGTIFFLYLLAWIKGIIIMLVVLIPIYVFVRMLFGYFGRIVK